MNKKSQRPLKWFLLLVLPVSLALFLREQRSWLPQVIGQLGSAASLWISPDGKRLAVHNTGGSRFPATVIIDAQTGAIKQKISSEWLAQGFSFSPNSQQFVIEDIVKNSKRGFSRRLNFYDLQTSKLQRHIVLPHSDLRHNPKLVWSVVNNRIFVLSRIAYVFSGETGQLLRSFSLSKKNFKALELSPDGSAIAGIEIQGEDANGMEKTAIYLWSTADGKLLRKMQQSVGRSTGIAFSKEGKLIATDLNLNRVSFNAKPHIQIWDARTGRNAGILKSSGSSQTGFYEKVRFSPTENLLSAAISPDSIFLYDVDTQKCSVLSQEIILDTWPIFVFRLMGNLFSR